MGDTKIVFTNKSDPNLLEFELQNLDVGFTNAIRRIILSEIDTVAFNTSDYKTSDIKIIENTSSLHNEFLLHRLGLVPIYNVVNTTDYKFILNIQNNTNKIIDVTTRNFKVINTKSNVEEEVTKFFPPDPITGDNILLIRLKPNPGGEGEKINLEGTASIGNGKMNSRFSPVSNIMFVNKKDNDKFIGALQSHVESLSDDIKFNAEKLEYSKKSFEINESERYFYTDEEKNPNVFEFTIESVGVIPSYILLKQALEKIIFKLDMFLNNLKNKDETVVIKESPTVMKAMDVIIKNENHTLGSLLQTYLNKNKDVSFVGFQNPHPLINEIIIRIATDSELEEVIEEACSKIRITTNELLSQINQEFNISAPKKRIIRKKKTVD